MDYNLADLFESVVDVVPEREALVCGERRLTYRELDERANRSAHHLASCGIGPGDHVGLYLRNRTPYLETMIAAFKLRAVPININFRYVEEELRYLCDDADLAGLIFEREFASRVAAVRAELPKLRALVAVDDGSRAPLDELGAPLYEEAIAAASAKRDFPPRSPDDQMIIYTGGTTGMPKGVMWRHEDIFFAGMAGGNPGGPPPERPGDVPERARERPSLVMMVAPPLIHGAAQLGSFISFLQGSKAVLMPRFDAREVWETVERERVQTISLVGDAMARPLADLLHESDAFDLSSLIVISSAGAILSGAVRDALTGKLPNLVLIDSFGSSETGFQGSAAPGSSPDKGLRFQMNASTSVLDDELEPIEPGSGRVGRIALSGHVPLGYYNDPEKTARTFVEAGGKRWSLPGDMATIEVDGSITVFGRGSVCINSGGEKIFPEEVEAALKSHPEVFDAVVVGVPDERWGQRVAAVLEARGKDRPGPEALGAHCRSRIAGYKLPREVHWVARMQRSPSGKADYPWAQRVARGEIQPG